MTEPLPGVGRKWLDPDQLRYKEDTEYLEMIEIELHKVKPSKGSITPGVNRGFVDRYQKEWFKVDAFHRIKYRGLFVTNDWGNIHINFKPLKRLIKKGIKNKELRNRTLKLIDEMKDAYYEER